MKTEHILIIRFSAIGDVAMTVPVVYSLARQYPDLRITMLSRPFARPFFENLAPNVGFMEADIKGEYRGVKGLNALYRRLTAKQFTAIADLHSVLRSDYLRLRFHLDRYKVAHLDKHRKERRHLVSAGNKRLVQLPTSFQSYADVFAGLGYPVRPDFTSIFGDRRGDLSLLPHSISSRHDPYSLWIGIAPFAAHAGKIYPVEKMRRVIDRLVSRCPHCHIFLFGGKSGREREVMDRWAGEDTHVTNASALLNGIREELILMSHLRVMVSMDSANMHLASLVGTPVVSIWGATHPFAGFMGWRQDASRAVQLDLPCRPCSIYGNKPCLRHDYACLQGITPDDVTARIAEVLEQKS